MISAHFETLAEEKVPERSVHHDNDNLTIGGDMPNKDCGGKRRYLSDLSRSFMF
jgi:hypothetical protein